MLIHEFLMKVLDIGETDSSNSRDFLHVELVGPAGTT